LAASSTRSRLRRASARGRRSGWSDRLSMGVVFLSLADLKSGGFLRITIASGLRPGKASL
jgi:hypothetical protein